MSDTQILERLASLPPFSRGGHNADSGQACAMEVASFIAGEPWSDHPQCVSPVIAAFMRSWNDSLPDAERDTLLRPLLPIVLNTRSTDEDEQRRATMAADWMIRVHTPAWLRLAKLNTQAELLESLPEITDFAQCPSIMPTLQAIRFDADAAWDAAWDAARAAVWDAVRPAALDAARAAAWDAALDAALDAARDAARAAALDAAGAAALDAAGAAALDAAGDALSNTKLSLQKSAQDLIRRMCTP